MGLFGAIFGGAESALPAPSGGPPFLFSTGTPNTTGTAVWPAHAPGDVGILVIETQGLGVTPTFGDDGGFVAFTGTPLYNSGPQTSLGMYWCRATSSAMSAPTFSGGDHIIAQIFVIRDVRTTGDPFDAVATSNVAHVGSVMQLPGVTTALDGSLVLSAVATIDDTSGSSLIFVNFRDYTNANLTGLVEIGDVRTAEGLGGGFGVCAGRMDTSGATGVTTCVHTNASNFASSEPYNIAITIALPGGPLADSSPPQITNVDPADGELITANKIISFHITDDTQLTVCAVLASFPDGSCEVVHDGDHFRGNYIGGANTRNAITGGFRYNVRRNGGWLQNPTFEYLVLDGGNLGVLA